MVRDRHGRRIIKYLPYCPTALIDKHTVVTFFQTPGILTSSLDYLEPSETAKITCYISNEAGINEILKQFFEWQLFFLKLSTIRQQSLAQLPQFEGSICGISIT